MSIIIIIFLALMTPPENGLRVLEDRVDEGQSAMKIEAETYQVFLQDSAGGISSLLDRDGQDWVSFNRAKGPKGMYRGLPNLVFPENFFHPGYNHCSCRMNSNTDSLVEISCSSNNQAYMITYQFRPTYFDITVTKSSGSYWFLYEGTPGGQFEPEKDYIIRSDGEIIACNTSFSDTGSSAFSWFTVIDPGLKRGLVIQQMEQDTTPDLYFPMDGMTVLGMGRSHDKPIRRMEAVPNRFRIFFVENPTYDLISESISRKSNK